MEKGQSITSQLVLKSIEDKMDIINALVEENINIEVKTIPKDKIKKII